MTEERDVGVDDIDRLLELLHRLLTASPRNDVAVTAVKEMLAERQEAADARRT